MPRDGFQREIDYLRVSLTDRCNLGCVYCAPAKAGAKRYAPEAVMTTKEALRIVAAATRIGVRKVRLTGGEPLLRPDLIEIAAGISSLGVEDLSITTNGMLLGAMAARLRDAGIRRINVSLDSLVPARYKEITGGGDLARVQEGIAEAEAAGLDPIKLNMVPIRGVNDGEIADFARLTYESPRHVRYIEYMPAGGKWDSQKCIRSGEVRETIEREVGSIEKREFKGRGPSRNYVLKGAKGILGFISPVSHSFCYSCNRLRVTALGRIRPCLFSRTEVDVLTPMRKGAADDEIVRLIELAINSKPEGNYLADPGRNAIDTMSSIGG